MTYNQAKKASNERYLSKFKVVTLRIKPEELDAIKAAAMAAGTSVQSFLLDAARERMKQV